MKIVADAHIPYVREYFASYGDLVLLPGRTISAADVEDADILLVRSITHVNQSLLENSIVSFVGSVTAGADHLDTKWLDEAGISWCVAAGFNAPPVADYVVSTIAALQKNKLLRLQQLRAAVIGVGNVGRLVAEHLRLLGFEVICCDPVRALQEPGFISTPLAAIQDVDLISLHVPLTRFQEHATYHFIDAEFLKRQQRGCVLLNASRGAVINTQEALRLGKHLTWCFDVWEHEPLIDKTTLQQATLATPHIAGYSVQSKIRGIDTIYKIACARQVIEEQPFSPIVVPHQQLTFAEEYLSWQDIVLGVFNPQIVSTMMQTLLLPAIEYGPLFDEMRNQFNYRHEFSATRLVGTKLTATDAAILTKLGFKISN